MIHTDFQAYDQSQNASINAQYLLTPFLDSYPS